MHLISLLIIIMNLSFAGVDHGVRGGGSTDDLIISRGDLFTCLSEEEQSKISQCEVDLCNIYFECKWAYPYSQKLFPKRIFKKIAN